MVRKIKALVLFSGGLDSLLAVKILEKQGIETAGICFYSNFFGAEKAKKIAKVNNVKLFIKNFKKDILNLVKNPPHGLGKNMNPCIDCHALMFKRAREFANKNGYDFLASGEVLGQRPFSQNKLALLEVAKTAEEEILRPLSAKLLPETEMEKQGLVDRDKLLDLQGRQRFRQLELVKELEIEKFEAPAGGCLLTDPSFGKRLKKALDNFSAITENEVELLKYGRVYWLRLKENKNPILVVIGREKKENENLEKLFLLGDFLLKPKKITGPNILIRFFGTEVNFDKKEIGVKIAQEIPKNLEEQVFGNETKMLNKIGEMGGWYITKARGDKIFFNIFK